MNIVCVCGFGMGSSLILKMTVEKAMKNLGLPCEVEHQAAGMIGGVVADIIVASDDFRDELAGRSNTLFTKSIVDVAGLQAELKDYIASHQLA